MMYLKPVIFPSVANLTTDNSGLRRIVMNNLSGLFSFPATSKVLNGNPEC
jgi:hypothetical protein